MQNLYHRIAKDFFGEVLLLVPNWLFRSIASMGGALLIGVAASLYIPLPFTPVPITLQTLILFVASAWLGGAYALQMVGWYLTLGILGAPFFAGGTFGLLSIMGSTGGYLIGFLVAAAWIGYLQNRIKNRKQQFLLFCSASALLYACGVSWLAISLHMNVEQALVAGLWPFLAGDILKIFIATSITSFSFSAYRAC